MRRRPISVLSKRPSLFYIEKMHPGLFCVGLFFYECQVLLVFKKRSFPLLNPFGIISILLLNASGTAKQKLVKVLTLLKTTFERKLGGCQICQICQFLLPTLSEEETDQCFV